MITKANNTVLDLSDIDQILDMGGNRITNVGAPVVASDVATKDFVETQSFVPIDGSVAMTGNLNMGVNKIINVSDATLSGDAVSLSFLQANAAAQGYLNDPTITRDNTDTFTVGIFQASPIGASTPFATTTSSTTRQLTNLFLRASGQNGIDFDQGAFTVPALTTQSDISFGTGPNRITSGSGTPFSTFSSGDKVIVAGSASNDGTYDVTAATATTIDTAQTLTIEALGASVSIYRVVQDDTYHVFAALETGVGTVDLAVDDNAAGSNIGSDVSTGWEVVRRLWSFKLNSSSDMRAGIKNGSWWFYDNPPSEGSIPTSSTLTALDMPADLNLLALIGLHNNVFNLSVAIIANSGDLTGQTASEASGPADGCARNQFTATNTSTAGQSLAVTDTSGRVFLDREGTGGTSSFRVIGYQDERTQ